MQITQLLDSMWEDYTALNPKALEIYNLFLTKEQRVINDHVAFRTFNDARVNIDQYAKVFIKLGYKKKDQYHFAQKKLNAFHYEHEDKMLPKIFISELLLEEFSENLNEKVQSYLDQMPKSTPENDHFCISGRHWNLSFEDYKELKAESEYAAWLSAYGFRVNHFTVFINYLESFNSLEDLNSYVKSQGHKLNDSGGEIKGSKESFLEQSSTLAYNQTVQFTDGEFEIPSSYYEFAKRYEFEDGKLFHGFISTSADKIFESTDKGQ